MISSDDFVTCAIISVVLLTFGATKTPELSRVSSFEAHKL